MDRAGQGRAGLGRVVSGGVRSLTTGPVGRVGSGWDRGSHPTLPASVDQTLGQPWSQLVPGSYTWVSQQQAKTSARETVKKMFGMYVPRGGVRRYASGLGRGRGNFENIRVKIGPWECLSSLQWAVL